jgi:hypothetical protein
LTEELIDE